MGWAAGGRARPPLAAAPTPDGAPGMVEVHAMPNEPLLPGMLVALGR